MLRVLVSLPHCLRSQTSVNDMLLRSDIKWLEGFDSKIAVLINRDGVDPRDYGGKDQQE